MEEKNKKEPVYEKPLFKESEGLTFTEEIWKKFNGNISCMQCSNCHGCR